MIRLKKKADLSRAYNDIFLHSETGRMVLIDILRRCGVFNSSYIQNDPSTTIFNEGARNVGLQIMQMLEYNEAKVEQLMQMYNQNRVVYDTGNDNSAG